MSNKPVFGLNENIAGLLAYLGTFVTGIIFLIIEKENKFVRFCALQSTVFFGALWILSFIIGFIPILRGIVNPILGIVGFVGWVYLMYTAFKGQMFKIPVLGEVCWEQINK